MTPASSVGTGGPTETGRRGDWIQTYTGGRFWPLDPDPSEIHVEDIAHSLSNVCRFGGHSRRFYSVAQHSVLVSEQLPDTGDRLSLWGLLHDASEAYLGDMVRPLKEQPGMKAYREAEERVQRAVAERFGLSWPIPREIALADEQLLITEARDLMGDPEWARVMAARKAPLVTLPFEIIPLGPEQARCAFIERFAELGGEL